MKRDAYSYEKGGYTLLSDPDSGVIDSIGKPGGWNDVGRFVSELAYAVQTGGVIESWMLGAGLSLRMADGTSSAPAIAFGAPTWAEGIYRINTGSLGVSMDIVPSVSGKDLGATGARWDLWANNIDAASNASFSGLVTIASLTSPRVVISSTGQLSDKPALAFVDPVLRVGTPGATTGYVALYNAATALMGYLAPPIWTASTELTLPFASGAIESQAYKDVAGGYAGLSTATRTIKGVDTTDDLIVDATTTGLVLKDASAHYWRLSVATTGTLVTTDLGTTKP